MALGSPISCPSCGVAIDAVSAHTRSLQCPHCDNWVYLGNNGWAASGSFEHALDAPSFVQLGRSGSLQGRAFLVRGRSRLSYDSGYWDEWWLEFEDGNHHWLEEDDGRYRLHSPVRSDITSAALAGVRAGSSLDIGGKKWFVTEQLLAQVAGTEGSLPVAVIPGEQMSCIDAISDGQKFSIEASDEDVSVTQSRVIAGDELVWE